ncbi:hypothetical protein AVEN_144975-1, partial [Araneus ventricosus]
STGLGCCDGQVVRDGDDALQSCSAATPSGVDACGLAIQPRFGSVLDRLAPDHGWGRWCAKTPVMSLFRCYGHLCQICGIVG